MLVFFHFLCILLMNLSLLFRNICYMCDCTVCVRVWVGVSVSLQPAVCAGSDCGLERLMLMRPHVSLPLLLPLPLNYTPAGRGIHLPANCSGVSSDKNAIKSEHRHTHPHTHTHSCMHFTTHAYTKNNCMHVTLNKTEKLVWKSGTNSRLTMCS